MAKLTFETNRCKGCGLCVSACPKKILRLSETGLNAKGYHPIEMIEGKEGDCIACAFCATMCPDVIIKVEK